MAALLGWWSNRLESREPAWLVGAQCHAPLPLTLATLLTRECETVPEHCFALTAVLAPGRIEVAWGEERVRVDLARPGAVVWSRAVTSGGATGDGVS